MLLVTKPGRSALYQIISDLFEEKISRDEVLTWQRAVHAEFGWNIPIAYNQGYWYFYALGFAALQFPDGPFLRQSDFAEYLVDMDGVAGDLITAEVLHLRSHQIDTSAIRWPIAVMNDVDGLMERLPGVRGTFEQRMGMVEHCHLQFGGEMYLLVKEYDEMAGQLLLLGARRDHEAASALMQALAVSDYMFP